MQEEKDKKAFVGYEYKEITVNAGLVSMYLDGYENFGWIAEETAGGKVSSHEKPYPAGRQGKNQVTIRMKRVFMKLGCWSEQKLRQPPHGRW